MDFLSSAPQPCPPPNHAGFQGTAGPKHWEEAQSTMCQPCPLVHGVFRVSRDLFAEFLGTAENLLLT